MEALRCQSGRLARVVWRSMRAASQERTNSLSQTQAIGMPAPAPVLTKEQPVVRWQQILDSAPQFAAEMRRHFDARTHKTVATLRADGSPRISGIEVSFANGDLWFGSMPNARKAHDLRRDQRFALHSGSIDPPDWEGDAKISGRAQEVEPNQFRADIEEAVVVRLNEAPGGLVIELWRPGRELKRIERA